MKDIKFTKDGVEFFNNYFYLTETEANALQDEVVYMFEIDDHDDVKQAKQGLQLAAILDFLLRTRRKDDEDVC